MRMSSSTSMPTPTQSRDRMTGCSEYDCVALDFARLTGEIIARRSSSTFP